MPVAMNQVWSVDFMSDSLVDGRLLRTFNVLDDYNNAYIERYNRTVRHEWLDMHVFESVAQAQQLATEWLWLYNNERPNTAIGGVPPRSLLKAA